MALPFPRISPHSCSMSKIRDTRTFLILWSITYVIQSVALTVPNFFDLIVPSLAKNRLVGSHCLQIQSHCGIAQDFCIRNEWFIQSVEGRRSFDWTYELNRPHLSSLLSNSPLGFPWKELLPGSTVCDVGCGIGHISLALAKTNPHLQLTLQDQPQVLELARDVWFFPILLVHNIPRFFLVDVESWMPDGCGKAEGRICTFWFLQRRAGQGPRHILCRFIIVLLNVHHVTHMR